MADNEIDYPYHQYDFFIKHFLKQRKVFLWGEVNSHSSYLIVNALKYFSSKSLEPVYIYINSEGGNIDSMISVLDEMERIKELGIVVCTIAQGAAYSCAGFLLGAGTKGYRIATPNSTILLHPISYSLDFQSSEKNKLYSDFIDRQNNSLLEMIAGFCNKTTATKLKKFKDDVKNEIWLSAKEAVKFGICDSVGDI